MNRPTHMRHVAVIPAKALSSRCPEKNWRPFAGGPCLTERALASVPRDLFDMVIVSTDRTDFVPTQPCTLHRRSADLATVQADVQDLLRVLIEAYALHDACIWLLNPTAPFRDRADYDGICTLLNEGGAPAVVSVTPVGPFVWRGAERLFESGGRRVNTQDAPAQYCTENGMFYAFQARAFLTHGTWYVPGVQRFVQHGLAKRVDIDTPEDFAAAERLWHAGVGRVPAAADTALPETSRNETLAIESIVAAPLRTHVPLLANHFGRYLLAAERLRIGPQDRVLDASCGKGYGSFILAQRAGHVTGLDIAPHYLSVGQATFAGENVTFASYEAYFAHPAPPVDKLVCIETYEHLPPAQTQSWVARLLGALRVGGDAFFTFPLGQDGPSATNPHHLNEPRLGTAQQLLGPRFRAANFDVVTRRDSFGQLTPFCCATLLGYLGDS